MQAWEAGWREVGFQKRRLASPLGDLIKSTWPAFSEVIESDEPDIPWTIEDLRSATSPAIVRLRQEIDVWAHSFRVVDDWVLDAALGALRHRLDPIRRRLDPEATGWGYRGEINPSLRIELKSTWSPEAEGCRTRESVLDSLAKFQRRTVAAVKKACNDQRRQIRHQVGDVRYNTPALARRFVLAQLGLRPIDIVDLEAQQKQFCTPQAVWAGIRVFAKRIGSRIPRPAASKSKIREQLG